MRRNDGEKFHCECWSTGLSGLPTPQLGLPVFEEFADALAARQPFELPTVSRKVSANIRFSGYQRISPDSSGLQAKHGL